MYLWQYTQSAQLNNKMLQHKKLLLVWNFHLQFMVGYILGDEIFCLLIWEKEEVKYVFSAVISPKVV